MENVNTSSHYSTIYNILFILIIGLVSPLMRYEIFEALKGAEITFFVTTIIWLCILFCSINCIYLYYNIFCNNIQTIENIWKLFTNRYGRKPLLLAGIYYCFSVITFSQLGQDMYKWHSQLTSTDYRSPVIWLYYILWISRLIQHFLSCESFDR